MIDTSNASLSRQIIPKTLFRGVRSSRFRNVFAKPHRKENGYDCIKVTKNTHDSYFCTANPKFLAVVTETAGGGSFVVIPINRVGRQPINTGKVVGHQGPVLDLKWNPFNDNVIASCSDDTTIKLWHIPDTGLLLNQNLIEPLVTLSAHKRRVSSLEWHPTAENILFSVGFDHLVMIWNVDTKQMIRVHNNHPDMIHSLSFNRDGSLYATTCKDKKLRIIDARSGEVKKEGICHHGSKAARVAFLGDTGRLFTAGFSKYSDRQWAVWSQHDLTVPLRVEDMDSSSGVLFPYYDHDTRLLYLAGKGDGNIRYYEIVDDPPWCYYLNQYITPYPQRGLGIMPKRGLDVFKCEVYRFYKLHAAKPQVEVISMIVPRKSEQFHDDLYPDTCGPTAALTATEWLEGKNRNPILISLKSGASVRTQKPFFSPAEKENGIKLTNGTKEVDTATVCEIVTSHKLPIATFVTLGDSQDSPTSELRDTIFKQQATIKSLQDTLIQKDCKIKELEDTLIKLTTTNNHKI